MSRMKCLCFLWMLALVAILLTGAILQFDKRGNGVFQNIPAIWSQLDDSVHKFAYLVDTPACNIPNLDPMSPEVSRFVIREPLLVCGKSEPPIQSDLTSVLVRDASLTDCCYQSLHRKGDNDYWYSEKCTEFPSSGVSVLGNNQDLEFLRIKCLNRSAQQQHKKEVLDFHAFVPLKPDVEQRCREQAEKEKPHISVMLLGIDSVSRLNFHRQMPATSQILRRLGAVEMLGYNKVGDNTFPNIMPVFTGSSDTELKNKCWSRRTVFDKCPFVWKDFRKRGYRTLFMEDIPYISVFNFEKPGFDKAPTDYYIRPFMKALDQEIGHHGLETSNRCAGPRLQVQIVLDYVKKFTMTFNSSLYWGYVWSTSISHDNLNNLRNSDLHYSKFFGDMYDTDIFNNTVVVFFSDHGIRTGKIRQTYQGRLEERLPFLFFVFPDWFRQQYSSAVELLELNARRLTSPYDLHETLQDFLHMSRFGTRPPTQRGMSLFGPYPVPENRTCDQAGISPHWCTCHETTKMDADSEEAKSVAVVLVGFINKMLSPYKDKCSVLELARVVEVRNRQHPSSAHNEGEEVVKDYLVTVETTPGGGLFEASVGYHSNTFLPNNKAISRINLYGTQSDCIDDYHLKLFCYCIDTVS